MTDLPFLPILLLTYKRVDLSLRTIRSTVQNLGYPKERICWYICDDGSPKEDHQAVYDCLKGNDQLVIGEHNRRIRAKGHENTFHAGMSYNKGLGLCHQKSDFVLVLENDWELDEPLDVVPYVKLLQEREDVGIVNFRILSTDADVRTIGYGGRMYLRYLRTTQYAFSGNPYIRHARFTKEYGWFAENLNPGDMEIHQDDMYRYKQSGTDENKLIPRGEDDGPQIWRPADISVWGAWKHIGTDKSWT